MNLLIQSKHMIGRVYRSVASIITDIIAKIRGLTIKNREFVIVSDNCWGGFIYQRYGIEYQTPTIGLFFYPEDYIKFLENIDYYLGVDLVVKPRTESRYAYINPEREYYIGVLDDIELQLLHYHSPEEAIDKWKRRKERFNKEHLLVKMSNRSSLFTSDIYERFDKLPFKNKIMFTQDSVEYKWAVYVPEFKEIVDTNVSEIPYTLKKIRIGDLINEI